jgi:hypothetical protein
MQCSAEGCTKKATKQIGLPWDPAMFIYCDEHAIGPWPRDDFEVTELPPGFGDEVPDFPPGI